RRDDSSRHICELRSTAHLAHLATLPVPKWNLSPAMVTTEHETSPFDTNPLLSALPQISRTFPSAGFFQVHPHGKRARLARTLSKCNTCSTVSPAYLHCVATTLPITASPSVTGLQP